MKNPQTTPFRFTRRDMVKGGAVLFGASLIGCENPTGGGTEPAVESLAGKALSGRQRVAIIGGGAGGVAAAYLLGGAHDVDLFEANSKIGGHCDSRVVDFKGQKINVDLGAQFFHPDTHPIYVTLLEELGLFNPDSPDGDETIEAPGSICFPKRGGLLPVFSSAYPYLTPFLAIDFAIYSQYARNAVLQNQSWEITVEDWIRNLPVSQSFKDTLLLPWISALIGTNLTDAKRSSARSILQTFALAFPANIFKGASTFNSKLGLGGNLQRMLDRSSGVQTHLGSPVTSLDFQNGAWTVKTAAGTFGPFDSVVMNAPPHFSRTVLRPLQTASDVVPLLDKYEYFDARMLIHTDPKYVHRDKNFWAVYNGLIDGANCEGSVWYGGIHPKLPTGATIDVFKSWANRRFADPANILYERRFKHPLITPESIRAARALRTFQGRNGLYFSGQATAGMDLQESAVYSAIQVANSLAPASPTLLALRARLEKRGRSKINYDL